MRADLVGAGYEASVSYRLVWMTHAEFMEISKEMVRRSRVLVDAGRSRKPVMLDELQKGIEMSPSFDTEGEIIIALLREILEELREIKEQVRIS